MLDADKFVVKKRVNLTETAKCHNIIYKWYALGKNNDCEGIILVVTSLFFLEEKTSESLTGIKLMTFWFWNSLGEQLT